VSDFDLYYWPLPFRGQFVRAILAYANRTWTERDAGENTALMMRKPADQPIAFMGPPLLIDNATGSAISQMVAISIYLDEKLAFIDASPTGRAMTAKVAGDANDVIDELTLHGGTSMWTPDTWQEFIPRLRKWMRIFEDTGRRHGLTVESGFLLGTPEPGIADIITATLWSTMADRFSQIALLAEETVPTIWGLTRRMQSLPALEALARRSFTDFGDAYCGGDIEKSLRAVAS